MTNAQAALIAAATYRSGTETSRAQIQHDAEKFLDWLNAEDAETK